MSSIKKFGWVSIVLALASGIVFAISEPNGVTQDAPQPKQKRVTGLKALQEQQEREQQRQEKRRVAEAGKRIDINAADALELKSLPGIGDKEAAKIIAGRPYGSRSMLLSRGVLDPAIYAGIRKRIAAGPLKPLGLKTQTGSQGT